METSLTKHICYICPECNELQQTYRQWAEHLNEKHDYKNKKYEDLNFQKVDHEVYQCLKCKRRISIEGDKSVVLQLHHVTHIPNAKLFRCLYCEFQTLQHAEITVHLQSIHHEELEETNDYRNPKCNAEFYMRFQCPLCKQILPKFGAWLTHINKMHKETTPTMQRIGDTSNYYCRTCKRLFYTNNYEVLQRHRFSHLPYTNYYRCAFCKTGTSTKIGMLRHFVDKHRRIFAEARQYIKKPIEWGEDAYSEAENAEILTDKSIPHLCAECGTKFEKHEEWQAHLSRNHSLQIQLNFNKIKMNYYQCIKCERNLICKNVDALQRHYEECVHYESFGKKREVITNPLIHKCCTKTNANPDGLPKKLNLFTEPYDNQKVLDHLKKSYDYILNTL